jgi:spore germination protein YaaH
MNAISPPERGQPLDLDYIYQIVSQVNALNNAIASRGSSSSRINTTSETTANLRIWAQTIAIAEKSASNTQVISMPDFNYSSAGFKQVPVVTATIVNNGGVTGTDAGNSAQVILNNVNAQSASGIVRFGLSGGINISVNLVAIGIPN